MFSFYIFFFLYSIMSESDTNSIPRNEVRDRRSITSKLNARRAGLAKLEKNRQKKFIDLIASSDSDSSSDSSESNDSPVVTVKKQNNKTKSTTKMENEDVIKKIDSLEKLVLSLGQVVHKKSKKAKKPTKIINVMPPMTGGSVSKGHDMSTVMKTKLLNF
jgi:hypothetical protein